MVKLRQRGLTQLAIAAETHVSLSSVKNILKCHDKLGAAGLQTNYQQCGPSGIRSDALQVRQYCALKKWHPGYGYDKISSLLLAKYPTIKLVCRRSVYRWWHQRRLLPLRSQPPKPEKVWACRPHQVWQIDAKEMMQIAGEQRHCWLNVVDEYTGGVLDPPVFPLW